MKTWSWFSDVAGPSDGNSSFQTRLLCLFLGNATRGPVALGGWTYGSTNLFCIPGCLLSFFTKGIQDRTLAAQSATCRPDLCCRLWMPAGVRKRPLFQRCTGTWCSQQDQAPVTKTCAVSAVRGPWKSRSEWNRDWLMLSLCFEGPVNLFWARMESKGTRLQGFSHFLLPNNVTPRSWILGHPNQGQI